MPVFLIIVTTTFCCLRHIMSIALQQENGSLFKRWRQMSEFAVAAVIHSLVVFMPAALCWWVLKLIYTYLLYPAMKS